MARQTAFLDNRKQCRFRFFFSFLRHSAEPNTFQVHMMWFLLIYEAAVGFGKEIVLKLSGTALVLFYLPYAKRLSL